MRSIGRTLVWSLGFALVLVLPIFWGVGVYFDAQIYGAVEADIFETYEYSSEVPSSIRRSNHDPIGAIAFALDQEARLFGTTRGPVRSWLDSKQIWSIEISFSMPRIIGGGASVHCIALAADKSHAELAELVEDSTAFRFYIDDTDDYRDDRYSTNWNWSTNRNWVGSTNTLHSKPTYSIRSLDKATPLHERRDGLVSFLSEMDRLRTSDSESIASQISRYKWLLTLRLAALLGLVVGAALCWRKLMWRVGGLVASGVGNCIMRIGKFLGKFLKFLKAVANQVDDKLDDLNQ